MNLQIFLLLALGVGLSPMLGAEPAEGIPDWCKKLPRPAYKDLKRIEIPGDTWFEVYEVRPGVFAIYEPHQFEEVISYLIVGSEKALLFDTGMGIASIKKIVSTLTSLPVTVLNSHTHPDHVGGNHEFEKTVGVDTKFTRESSAGFHNQEMKNWVKPPNICGQLPAGFDPDQYQIPAFRINEFVSDGQVIDLGNRKLEILLTPGHTPDSACLVDAANKLLFTGDSFYLGPIYLFVSQTDLKAYENSIRRLVEIARNINLLLPSHNVPVASPTYLQKVLDALAAMKNHKAQGVRTKEGLTEYRFENFSLIVKEM